MIWLYVLMGVIVVGAVVYFLVTKGKKPEEDVFANEGDSSEQDSGSSEKTESFQ